MTTPADTSRRDAAPRGVRRFFRRVLDYAGMVAAMLAGMVLLDVIRGVVAPEPLRADLEAMVMATEMVIGMAVWMVARHHAWRGITIMSAVMYVPFLLLTPLFWVGAISGHALATGGHLLMLPAMALAMPFTHGTIGRGPRERAPARPIVESAAPSNEPDEAETRYSGTPVSPVRQLEAPPPG
jgi:hypothetical protein